MARFRSTRQPFTRATCHTHTTLEPVLPGSNQPDIHTPRCSPRTEVIIHHAPHTHLLFDKKRILPILAIYCAYFCFWSCCHGCRLLHLMVFLFLFFFSLSYSWVFYWLNSLLSLFLLQSLPALNINDHPVRLNHGHRMIVPTVSSRLSRQRVSLWVLSNRGLSSKANGGVLKPS